VEEGSCDERLTVRPNPSARQRAETVAALVSERFQIPAEKLTTQGHGQQYLQVSTQTAERQNRRVTLRRITPLLQGQAAR
jgi:outer membrane protein OmpA-like peptidoglycan-associated protein